MKKAVIALCVFVLSAFTALNAQQRHIDYPASATYLFATADTLEMYLDVFDPAPESETALDGKQKPTILWLFGGGFVGGERSAPRYLRWFKLLNDNGYRVISADYRTDLKGKKLGFGPFRIISSARKTVHACSVVGCQDLFSAVRFIVDNSEALGVDPANIVVSGSSAGAMIAVTAEWQICNAAPNTEILPEGFNFKGVMSFAGAIMSDSGKPSWASAPCPQLLFHGTKDEIVAYNKISVGKLGIFGTDYLVKALQKGSYPYYAVRIEGRGHEVAESMMYLWDYEKNWLEHEVMGCEGRTSDTLINDPSIPDWGKMTLKSIY